MFCSFAICSGALFLNSGHLGLLRHSSPSPQPRESSEITCLLTLSAQYTEANRGLTSLVSCLLGITVLHFLTSRFWSRLFKYFVLLFFSLIVSGDSINLVPSPLSRPKEEDRRFVGIWGFLMFILIIQ